MANTSGSFKNTLTTKIAMHLLNIGYSLKEAGGFRNMIHRKYNTVKCLEILKELRTKKTHSEADQYLQNL